MSLVERTINPSASRLRREQTDAERAFWQIVRNRQLGGHKFKRQVSVGPYVADFACLERGLIVELDGGQHAEQIEYDEARTRYLEAQGFRIVRIWNNELLTNADGVADFVLASLDTLTPTLSRKREREETPLPQAGEGDSPTGERGEGAGR